MTYIETVYIIAIKRFGALSASGEVSRDDWLTYRGSILQKTTLIRLLYFFNNAKKNNNYNELV